MKPSSAKQKRFEARRRTLAAIFLAVLNCKYQGTKGGMDLFLDNETGQLIGIQKVKTSKEELIKNLNIVRGNHDS